MPVLDLAIPGVTAPTLAETGMAKLPSVFEALKPPETDESPEKAQQRIAKDLERIAQKAFEAHHWYYREAVEAQAHYHGRQWGYFSDSEGRFVAVPHARSRWEVRVTLNLTKPIVDQATSILTTEEPLFIVGAATTEGRDAATSQVANDLTSYFWRQHRLAEVYRTAARESFITGTSLVHVEWDPTAGRPVTLTRVLKEPEFDAMGQMIAPPVEFEEERREGDLLFTLLDQSQVAWDPAAKTDTDGAYIFYRREVSLAQLREINPDVADKIEANGDPSSDGMPEMSEQADRYTRFTSSGEVDKKERETTTVYTLYLRTCAKYPRGKMIVFAQGEVLYEGDNPVYPSAEEGNELWPRCHWPIFAIRCDQRKTSPWGQGRVVGMMDSQKGLNGLYSKAITHAAAIANTKLLVPAGYQVQLTDELGQVLPIFRAQSVLPQYLNPPQMPDYVTLAEAFVQKMEYIAGINAASQGTLPSSDTSGRALQLLQQRDQGRLAPVKKGIDASWAEVLSFGLRLFRRHADLPRTLLIVGENLTTHVAEFSRAQLAQATDIITANDQSIPRDPMAKLLWYTQFTQTMQAVTDPALRTFIMESWRLKDFQHFLEQQDPHAVKAERNNLKIMQGEPVEYWEGDDSLKHKAMLEKLITSEEFERKVRDEQMDPRYGGQSPTLYAAVALWQQHTQAVLPQPGMVPGMGQAPGAPGGAVATPPAGSQQEGPGVATPRQAA